MATGEKSADHFRPGFSYVYRGLCIVISFSLPVSYSKLTAFHFDEIEIVVVYFLN